MPDGRRSIDLLRACHPEPAAAVTLLTCLLALAAGRSWGTPLLGLAVAAGQLGVGWSNDYLDRELDRRSGRSDKPLATARSPAPNAVRAAAIAALVAAVPLSLVVSPGFAAAHLGAVACALAYNAGLKARAVSVLPYTVAFGLLPVAVAASLPTPHWAPAWAIAAGALVGAGGHFTQALPDIPADRLQDIRGLPQLIGQTASAVAAATLLLAANLIVALAADPGGAARVVHIAIAAALTTGIVGAAASGHPRAAFRLTLTSAALAVLAFLAGGSRL